MFDFNAKHQKIVPSSFWLSSSIILLVSCAAAPVIITSANIANAVSTLISLIDVTQSIINLTSSSVNVSYQELGEDLRKESLINKRRFSNEIIEKMEIKHSNLLKKQKELDDSINKTNVAANNLFSMLETRANQNSTDDLKEKLLNNISVKKKTFSKKIEIAEDFSSKIKKSIKEYDDILGFFQVNAGLEEAQTYVNTVDSVISKYKSLNQEVQVALDEGRQLITNIEETPSQKPVRSIPISTPDENTTQQQEKIPSQRESTLITPTPIPRENTTQQQVNPDRPLLGVEIISLTEKLRQQINKDNNANLLIDVDKGVLVNKVVKDSSAAKAGIQAGDVILTVDGKAVTDASEVIAEVKKSQVGTELLMEVRRSQQNLKVLVRLSANSNTSDFKGGNN